MPEIKGETGPSGAIIHRRWLPLALLGLASFAALLAYIGIEFVNRHNLDIAVEGARNVCRTVEITLRWNANHGGV